MYILLIILAKLTWYLIVISIIFFLFYKFDIFYYVLVSVYISCNFSSFFLLKAYIIVFSAFFFSSINI